ncbi:hypothetical protein HGM15179_020344 [Zosterops borbonicus]|uniref:Uncharacterized protein n=1 Tax=Zosterops borbonicus TaxID=364589 RepID=A0A8K1D7Y3_9PASS|nr:hypothetical protein HGM15179_020344 [Zosterops borbonicus]
MFKAKVPSTHHATNTTWSMWIALITQCACIGKLNNPGIVEIITNWPEGENFGLTDGEEQEQVSHAVEALLYNQLPAEETWYALFTDGNPGIVEIITNWPEGENFGLTDGEEQEQVSHAVEALLYNQLPAEETWYALFTDGSCHIVEMKPKWKAAIWSRT